MELKITDHKCCSLCKQIKSYEEFYREKATNRLSSWCKPCIKIKNLQWCKKNPKRHAENSRRWRAENPERSKTIKRRWEIKNPEHCAEKHLKHRFGITLEIYNQKLSSQNGVCAICKSGEVVKERGRLRKLSVDHCHKTKKIRGLLCNACNVAIGKLKDDPEIILAAASYVALNGV